MIALFLLSKFLYVKMLFLQRNRRFTILILLIFIFLIYSYIPLHKIPTKFYLIYFYDKNSLQCYKIGTDEMLPPITSVDPRGGKSIFFHETSCNSYINGKIVITSREACAVESAARQNPNYTVYLLYTSPGWVRFENTESDRFLRVLSSYENIELHHLDYANYTKDTPLEDLYQSGRIEKSQYPQSHASDVLRYLTLWKYGGIYLDLDVIILKSLENLPSNFVACESKESVSAGIIGFDSTGPGHQLAEDCVNDLKSNFNGDIWGHNGPGVITRLAKKVFKTNKISKMFNKTAQNLTVYPPELFYPVEWRNWAMFFKEKHLEIVKELSKNSYMLHMWNKKSSNVKISVDSNVPYIVYAKKFCPNIFKECEKYF